MSIPKYVMLEKSVGQTPLECLETWRLENPVYKDLPLAYAGRLDPMASGKLVVLVGDECKVQEKYHGLDKRYEFSVLLGVGSDTGDVLGLLQSAELPPTRTVAQIKAAVATLNGTVTLPYPHFSSKTVGGKALHTWTLEGRLDEIAIPHKTSRVYKIQVSNIITKTRIEIYDEVSRKIELIAPVVDPRKAIGNDFRREEVRRDWKRFSETGNRTDVFTIINITCIASSGTYMRSLAAEIGTRLDTDGLAYHIHRTKIGTYVQLPLGLGFWRHRL